MNSVEELARLQKRFQEAAKVIDDLSRIKQELEQLSKSYKDKLSNNSFELSQTKQEIDSLSINHKEYKKYWHETFNTIHNKTENILTQIRQIENKTQSEIDESKTDLDKLQKRLDETESFLSEFKNNVQFNRNLTTASCLIGCIAVGLSLYTILFSPRSSPISASSSPQESSPNLVSPSTENPSIKVDFFREAVNKATRASTLAQSAKSKDDWNLVINEWQSAINMMRSISPSSSNYEIAQKKVIEYQKNLNYATQQAEQMSQ